MPFTPSHAVAVLPLATGRLGRTFVPAALVIGSWIPDLPYFVPPYRGSRWTHAASGPVTIDLVLGLAVFALWELLLRVPLTDLAPDWLRQRLPAAVRLSVRRWGWAAVSVVLGAVTHVVWDTFTHRDRWGTRHVPALEAMLGPLPVYKWFQFASGVLGLAALALWILVWVRRAAVRSGDTGRVGRRARYASWAVLVGTAAVGGLVGGLQRLLAGRSLEATAVGVATTSIGATGGALVLVCLAWWLASGRPLGQSRRVRQRPAQGGEG